MRAEVVGSLVKLDKYKWCGHGVVMNHRKNNWQDRDYVLKWFGKTEADARKSYRLFIQKGIALGKQPELTGGGLVRSMGGWSVVKSMRKQGSKEKGDDRILGSGDFLSNLLAEAGDKIKHQIPASDLEKKIQDEIASVCRQEKISMQTLRSGSRRNPLPGLRKTLAVKFVREYGASLTETARQLGISTSGVAQILRRNL